MQREATEVEWNLDRFCHAADCGKLVQGRRPPGLGGLRGHRYCSERCRRRDQLRRTVR